MEDKYSANIYISQQVVANTGKGIYVWDPEGRKYIDCLAAYSAVNQGHCHPKIIKVMKDQLDKITLPSRAFYNSMVGQWSKYITDYFNFESVLPMNTGAEGVEGAIKLARTWGYQDKKIPKDEALIITCNENFHGRTVTVISASDDPMCYENFGPLTKGFLNVEYNNVGALKKLLEKHGKKVAAFLVEPIQGEAGVRIPDKDYLPKCKELCEEHNVMLIADEIQTGLGRTGERLACDISGVKPDALILGKALAGGVYPMSAVLSDWKFMKYLTPGTHGSTYGGNPVACAVSQASLEIVKDEKLSENATKMGDIFREELSSVLECGGKSQCNCCADSYRCAGKKGSIVKEYRGKGLFIGIEIDTDHPKMNGKKLYDVVKLLKDKKLLTKQAATALKFSPPLNITEEETRYCAKLYRDTIEEIENGAFLKK